MAAFLKARRFRKLVISHRTVRDLLTLPGKAVCLLFLFFVLMATPALHAQVTSSSILGYVNDSTGAPIQNAKITVSDASHAANRTTTTDSSGAYILVGLAPAVYSITASAPGFADVTQAGVTLAVNSQLRTDFRMTVARVKSIVEVNASVRPIQTESAEVGTVVDQTRIQDLPLNRRDFLQLALLLPGVLPPVQGSELSTRGAFSMHAGGGREEFNNFLLDGADNNDPYVNRYGVEPPVDSIQELKVATNSYSAEYGRSGAGQVNVITRRGTNNFHGSLYEYFRNRIFDARNFFDTSTQEPQLIRNQFGFSLGGPIIRGKTYFFASIDFLRGKNGVSQLSTVPTLAERGGDLSALSATIVDPLTGIPFAGNQIPSASISSTVQSALNMFPRPNRPGTVGNYLSSPVQTENDTQGNFRVDHYLSAADVLTFRYSFGNISLFEPFAGGTNIAPGYGDFLNDHIQNVMLQYQRALGSRAINSFRMVFSRFSRDLLPENHSVDVGKLLGVSWLNVPQRDLGFPVFNVAGFSSVGDNFGLPILRHTNTFQFADNVTIDRGVHLLRFGGEFRALQLNGILDLFPRGSLSFSGFISGSGISDFLLGYPSFGIQTESNNPLTMRTKAFNVYFEDSWRVRPTFTVNLGLRYEFNTPTTDPTNRMSAFNLQTSQVVPVGTGGVTRSGIHPDHNNIAPRIGFAWSPTRSWVMRSGYGIYYDSGSFIVNSAQYFNPPQFNLRVFFPSPAGLLTIQDPFPTGAGFTPPPSLNTLNPGMKTPYIQQWNFTVERDLASWGTISLGYVGSKGTKLIRAYDINQPVPGPGDPQSNRPFPQFGGIFFIDSSANSSFNSLQALYNKRMRSHLSLWVAYTWSKSIDDASAFQGTFADPNFPQDSHNLRAERGNSGFDMRHRLAAAYVVQLPQGNLWTRNTEFRGITTVQSGQPLTPVLRFDNSNTGNSGGTTGSDRPNVLHGWKLSNPTPDQWFDVTAFSVPPPFTFGNAGRNIIRGPGYFSFDVSMVRHFYFTERWKLSCEAQAFNLFNHPNFDMPQPYADDPASFGKIFSAKSPRQLQFSLRLGF